MTGVPSQPTVIDTTVLSNFAYLERLDLVVTLPRVCTVPAVRSELSNGVATYDYLQLALRHLGEEIPVVSIDDQVRERAQRWRESLDPGEAEVFAIAQEFDGVVVTDDGPARTMAREIGLPVTGTIGILVQTVESGTVEVGTADRWLKQLIDETAFRAPSREFDRYLDE